MEGNIDIRPASSGYEYRVKTGQSAYYDDDGNRALDSPDTIVGGWAETEAAARQKAQDEFSDE